MRVMTVSEPLVEVDLTSQMMPAIFDRLVSAESRSSLLVVQRSRELARCLHLSGEPPALGDFLHFDPIPRPMAPVSVQAMEAAVAVLAGDEDLTPCETGIRALDVLSPVPYRGALCLIGGAGVGRLTLVEELHLRLAGKAHNLIIIFPITTREAHLVPEAMSDSRAFPCDIGRGVSTLWIPCDQAKDPALTRRESLGASRVALTPRLAQRDILPAVEPIDAHSRLLRPDLVGRRHYAIAERIRALMARIEKSHRELPSRFEDGSSARLSSLERRVERLISQPFFCREWADRRSGLYVPVARALDAFERALDAEDASLGGEAGL